MYRTTNDVDMTLELIEAICEHFQVPEDEILGFVTNDGAMLDSGSELADFVITAEVWPDQTLWLRRADKSGVLCGITYLSCSNMYQIDYFAPAPPRVAGTFVPDHSHQRAVELYL